MTTVCILLPSATDTGRFRRHLLFDRSAQSWGPDTRYLRRRQQGPGFLQDHHLQLSARIIETLRPPCFQTPEPIAVAEVDSAMDAGRYTFVLNLPPNLQADAAAGRQPAVQVNVDATAMAMAGAGAHYLERVLSEEPLAYFQGGDRDEPPTAVAAVTRIAFNPNGESVWFTAVSESAAVPKPTRPLIIEPRSARLQ